MSEPPPRKILSLKPGVARPAILDTIPAPLPVPPKWKCRPCGAAFDPPADLPDDERVRCPSCNARVGLAADFRTDPPPLERLRARPAKAPPPARPAFSAAGARPRSRPVRN